MRTFRDLIAFRKAYKMALYLHKLSLKFPKYEQVELAGQLRRASKSVALNIAEGFSRKDASLSEFKRFLVIARSSADEVRVCIDFCKDLSYITTEIHLSIEQEYIEIGKLLTSMLKNWT